VSDTPHLFHATALNRTVVALPLPLLLLQPLPLPLLQDLALPLLLDLPLPLLRYLPLPLLRGLPLPLDLPRVLSLMLRLFPFVWLRRSLSHTKVTLSLQVKKNYNYFTPSISSSTSYPTLALLPFHLLLPLPAYRLLSLLVAFPLSGLYLLFSLLALRKIDQLSSPL
jgi:hypothetical protein